MKTVVSETGNAVVINRNGKILLKPSSDEFTVPYGAVVHVQHGQKVEIEDMLAKWDPYNRPLIATTKGTVIFSDIIEGVTLNTTIDSRTGVELKLITSMSESSVPKIIIGDREYGLQIGSVLAVKEGEQVSPGYVIAKIPLEVTKSSDITGGLTRVLQILELRKLENPAILANISGEIRIHEPQGKVIPLEIIGEDSAVCKYHVPIGGASISVNDGDNVAAGDILVEGIVDPLDVLAVLGSEAAAIFAIGEVQKVYRSQGVEINDKHLEIILKKMLGFVEVTFPGDTDLITAEIITKKELREKNDACIGKKAVAKPTMLGLVRTALQSESWLSAASFQETASVLVRAAIERKRDSLVGTKENIIVGNMVPVGTGHPANRKKEPVHETPKETRRRKQLESFLSIFKDPSHFLSSSTDEQSGLI